MARELREAEDNQKPLLFFIVIPKTNLLKVPGYKKCKDFVKQEKLLDKSDILYVYYDNTFSYAITRPIINTYMIILHTSHIKEAVKKNVKKIL